jgi:hypothetical protein
MYSKLKIEKIEIFDNDHSRINLINDSINIQKIKDAVCNSEFINDTNLNMNWIYQIKTKMKDEYFIWMYDTSGILCIMVDDFPIYKIYGNNNFKKLLLEK